MKKLIAGFVVGLACGLAVPFMPQVRFAYSTHPMQMMTVELKRDRLTGERWERIIGIGGFKPVKTSATHSDHIIDPVALALWPCAFSDD